MRIFRSGARPCYPQPVLPDHGADQRGSGRGHGVYRRRGHRLFFLKVEASAAGKLPLPFHTSYAYRSAPSGPGPEKGRRLAALMVVPRRAGRGRARSCRPARARQRRARRRDAADAAGIGGGHPAHIPVNFLPRAYAFKSLCARRKRQAPAQRRMPFPPKEPAACSPLSPAASCLPPPPPAARRRAGAHRILF